MAPADQTPPHDLTIGEVWRGNERLGSAMETLRTEMAAGFLQVTQSITDAGAGYVSRAEYVTRNEEWQRRLVSLEESRTWVVRGIAAALVTAVLAPLIVAYILSGPR